MKDAKTKVGRSLWVVCIALGAMGCAEMGAPLSERGRVVAQSGDGASEGAECRVAIVNEGRGRYVCRVEVECEGRMIYGGPTLGGYTNCEAREGSWVRVWDPWLAGEDGDPWLDWDVEARTVVVRTDTGETHVSVDG